MQFGGILTAEEISLALKSFELETSGRKRISDDGEDSKPNGLVEKGILRIFYCPKDDQEVTRYFVREGQYAVDLESYYSNLPSENTFKNSFSFESLYSSIVLKVRFILGA